MTLTVGSLFSGIGGLDLGLERAGMKVVWQVEKDEYARRVLAKHWHGVPCYHDVRQCSGGSSERGIQIAPVDLICGGFPCQDISVAGKGAGIKEGTRSGLWIEFARIVRELRPHYVLVENVPALRSRGLDRVLGDLAASGYDAEWDGLSASAVGAPHRRDRLFAVAYLHSARRVDGARVFAGEPGKGWTKQAGDFAVTRAHSGRLRVVPPSGVRRVDDGLSEGVDRLRCLGNAVVPQVAEFIGRRILEHARR